MRQCVFLKQPPRTPNSPDPSGDPALSLTAVPQTSFVKARDCPGYSRAVGVHIPKWDQCLLCYKDIYLDYKYTGTNNPDGIGRDKATSFIRSIQKGMYVAFGPH